MPRWIATVAVSLLIAVDSEPLRVNEPPEESYRSVVSYSRDGDFETALAAVRRAGRKWKDQRRTEWYWRFRLLEAELMLEQNQVAGLNALLEDGAAIGEQFPEVRVRRRALKARRDMRVSKFEQAAREIEDAEKIASEENRSDLLPEVQLLRGQILARQLRLQQAEHAFEQAQQSAEQAHDEYWKAAAATNRGLLRVLRSRSDQAIPLFEQARQISLRLGADRMVVGADNNLGICYSQLGDFDRALRYREEALRLARPNARLADVLGETGTLYLVQGQTQKAIQFYRRALETAKQFGVLPEAARWAGNLTSALTEANDLDAAERALDEALALRPEPRNRMHLELAGANIAHRRGRPDEARRVYERTIASAPENAELLWRSHSGLARIFREERKFEQANASFEAAIRVIESNRSDLNRTEHRMTFLSSLIRFYQDYVDSLMTQNLPVRALEVVEASRAQVLAERVSRSVDYKRTRGEQALREVARDSGSVLLSYWVAPERSFLWVVTSNGIRHFQLPPAASLTQLVTEYRAFVESSVRDPLRTEVEAGRKLYEALIKPAEPFLQQHARVTIVPDGPLHHLAFDTLPVYGQTPHYWVEDAATSITPSLLVFRGAIRKPSTNTAALIIGDPMPAGSAYGSLPYAGVEIAKVSARLQGHTRIIRGADAQPSVYRTAMTAGAGIIHIAAHAEANPLNPLESAVILSPSADGFKLYARAVADVPINTDVVTLSACRSSGARAYAGEGLVGLAWAFLQAGSRSVVAGLWDVADESTAALMDEMYASLAAGASPCEALRNAKLRLRRTQYSKPYYWGPFQCYVR
jgi:CHAT domain-containing protein/Tfp pilus assembly protein PilF